VKLRWIAGGLVFAALMARGPSAHAEDEATRQAARDLAQEGVDLLRRGKLEEAQERLHKAYELFPAPTIALYEGQALEKLGRLVEAAERYQAAKLSELPADANSALRNAVDEAAREVQRLAPLIPKLTVEVEGVAPSTPGLEVRVDAEPLPLAMLGVRRPIDPGEHEVSVALGGTIQQTRKVTLAAGGAERVVLRVAPGRPTPVAMPSAGPVDTGPKPSRSMQRTWGFVSLGVGGAGLVTGIVSGAVMLGKDSTLERHCPNNSCPPAYQGDLDTFTTARTVSFIGYGVGIAGLGAGALLLLTAPREPRKAARATITPFIGPAAGGVTGTF
jgi:hypothetical protein